MFPSGHGINSHYGKEINRHLQAWFTNPLDHLYIGWLPAAYSPPAIKPYATKLGKLNMCCDPQLIIDERFVYNHKEQIFGKRILDLYDANINFINFDHPKKGLDLFAQWFKDFQLWLNTIRNEKDHLIISTDGSFKDTIGTAAYALWANHLLINSSVTQVSAHSAYDAKLQAIQLAFEQFKLLPFKRVTILIDNESAARSIWRTDFHNLQNVSIKAMTNFREWATHFKSKDFIVNISWCPAHMDVHENELVDLLTSELIIEDIDSKTTLESEIRRIKILEYDSWNKGALHGPPPPILGRIHVEST
ncbi:hypothetical protein AX15_002880 [Amanita polypyramis BW_CC]|nr:hypothetical protein AX15_002880 [Amanita polypyramis BW_CC]